MSGIAALKPTPSLDDVQCIPSGYKQTDIGTIPEDWQQHQIRDIATKIGSGITPTGGINRYKVTGRPFVRSQNVGWGTLLLADLCFIDDSTHHEFPATELRLGDVLLNITGASIGRSSVADERLVGGNVNQHVCIVRADTKKANPNLVNLVLLSGLGQKQIESFQAGGNRQGLNFVQVGSIKIPLPPTLAEQQAIAEALSDADALIEGLESLIAKKRAIKQGAMQDLLTGKRRLPGFKGEWINACIHDIAAVGRGRVISHAEISRSINPIYPVYSSQTSNDGIMGLMDTFMFEGDYVTWTTDGANAGTVFYRSGRFNCTNVCGTIKLHEQLASHAFVANALGIVAKGHVSRHLGNPKLMNDVMKRITIRLPPTASEQTAIAAVLSDIDAEIEALDGKLAKARAVKQGMMQELLTGRVRLV